ncbi:hypothetical protein, partial [Ideonella sp.]|uniref:hypothetical protein n=1 Tax=Ideonella sp. TaxID=1929293 RepID=UPI003BB48FDD
LLCWHGCKQLVLPDDPEVVGLPLKLDGIAADFFSFRGDRVVINPNPKGLTLPPRNNAWGGIIAT